MVYSSRKTVHVSKILINYFIKLYNIKLKKKITNNTILRIRI